MPTLEGDAADAVAHRGGHIQIIAAAGSGKTEVVSQRVADLIATGVEPRSIVAFTFTEKAAAELKERIRQRVTARVGHSAGDKLGQLQVSTIHAYCFRLLQTYDPHFEAYSLVDENQLVALMSREGSRLNLKRFGRGLFDGIKNFLRSVDVLENELIDVDALPDGDFKDAVRDYYATLDRYRVLTFGQQIVQAVRALEQPTIHAAVTAVVEHLIVDEYQDINPAQERLISLLASPTGRADLVVVGDDDQAIYQWRGSAVDNIVTFTERYPDVAQFRLLTNRRSRPGIVALANEFAGSIPGRLDKEMLPSRPASGESVKISVGTGTEADEASDLAKSIVELNASGVPFRSIAVLVRGKAAYPRIMDAFAAHGIPVQPGGRTGLFEQPAADALGSVYAWLADLQWKFAGTKARIDVTLDEVVLAVVRAFTLNRRSLQLVRHHLTSWKARASATSSSVDLIGDLYALLGLLGVKEWNLDDLLVRNALGTIARFTQVLADYESVQRRSRRDTANPGEQVGTAWTPWYYKSLAILMVNYASGEYDDFDGEEDLAGDAVALGTVHGAKGLEWPVVFLPSLTKKRFPSMRTGSQQTWLLPREMFDASRYEGSDADERRLFYVAVTRARDWVSLSSHARVTKQSAAPSPYLESARAIAGVGGSADSFDAKSIESPDLQLSYSDVAAYLACGRSYLLRSRLGFLPPVRDELGYGNAVHHVMRVLAERTKDTGEMPSASDIDALVDSDFFLPFANKPAHRLMKARARALVQTYLDSHPEEFLRTWATERPFELFLDGVVVAGRADVIYDEHDGVPSNLAIVDYKTATGPEIEPLQLQIYADAGRREGLTVSAGFVHDMGQGARHSVDVSDGAIAAAEVRVQAAASGLRSLTFAPAPTKEKCKHCDVRLLCKDSAS
ncbi:ATP-dependent helicase [Microbacterium hominis]|uniref:DNA 3'-5' helicase n=1 Tax=Microbacterium hominis TaxID=162426 RepID=A0A7D4PXL5_9MICO|nr:ATP-dependent helicase [Microbacterium hominis]